MICTAAWVRQAVAEVASARGRMAAGPASGRRRRRGGGSQPGLHPSRAAPAHVNEHRQCLHAGGWAFRGLNLACSGSACACWGLLRLGAPCAPPRRRPRPASPSSPQGIITGVPTRASAPFATPRVAAHPSSAPVGRVTHSQGHHGEGADPWEPGGGRWGAMQPCTAAGGCRRRWRAGANGSGPMARVAGPRAAHRRDCSPSKPHPTRCTSNPRSRLPPPPDVWRSSRSVRWQGCVDGRRACSARRWRRAPPIAAEAALDGGWQQPAAEQLRPWCSAQRRTMASGSVACYRRLPLPPARPPPTRAFCRLPASLPAEEIRALMEFKHNIRNMSVIAHVDHGARRSGWEAATAAGIRAMAAPVCQLACAWACVPQLRCLLRRPASSLTNPLPNPAAQASRP